MIVGWTKSFLSGRTYQVRVGGECSSYSVLSGVSQGAVLSPLLLPSYTNEIPGPVERFRVSFKMDADDVEGYEEVENQEACCDVQAATNFVEKLQTPGNYPLRLKNRIVLWYSKESRSHPTHSMGQFHNNLLVHEI